MTSIERNLVKLFEGPTNNIFYSADLYYTQIDIQRAVNRVMAEEIDRLDEMYPQLEDTVARNIDTIDAAYDFLHENLITEEDRERLEAINQKLINDATPEREEVLRLCYHAFCNYSSCSCDYQKDNNYDYNTCKGNYRFRW